MKRFSLFALLALFISCTFDVLAVTDKEMEQARTIATKWYLRYANDGSGYLDEINPKTMADLEKALKTKEKENIKAFKAIPVPSDYKSWDKQKLIDYWAVTAFKTKGLIEKGRQGGNRAKKYITNMTVTPPQAEAPVAEKKEEKPQQPVTETAANPQDVNATQNLNPTDSALLASQADLNEAEAAILDETEELDSETSTKKAGSYTWVYIMVLAILVGVVIALVVFASNVLKKNPRNTIVAEDYDGDAAREISRYKAMLADKDSKIEALSSKLESANVQNASLKSKLEALATEVTALRSRLAEGAEKQAERQQQVPVEEKIEPVQPVKTEAPAQRRPLRTIYLGRANSKGIFIRADRNLNIGNSIYRLDTSDGFSGTFRVAEDPTVWKMALLTPRESLAGACQAPDLEDTDGMTEIITDSAGTAVFEGGCWRVSRKAKIHYE